MELILVRHAQAAPRGSHEEDGRRPLDAKGERQALALRVAFERTEWTLDRLFSSPLLRAAQTAEPLRASLRHGRTVEYLDALAQDDPPATLTALNERLAGGEARVACVGHEPALGHLAATLLGVDLPIALRKASALLLEGDVAEGGMALGAFLPMRLLGRLLRDPGV